MVPLTTRICCILSGIRADDAMPATFRSFARS
jgi:hypothetical protein